MDSENEQYSNDSNVVNVPVANKESLTRIQLKLRKYNADPTTFTTPQKTNKTYPKCNTITNKSYALLVVESEKEQCSNDSDDSNFVPSLDFSTDSEMDLLKVDISVKFSAEMQNLFIQFGHYLSSPYGGNRNSNCCYQIVSDIKKMCTELKLMSSISDLFKDMYFRDMYLMGYCKKKKLAANSINKYLISLDNFCHFILYDQIDINVSRDKIEKLRTRIESWKKAYKKQRRDENWVRELDDITMLVSENQVKKYINSDHATRAKTLFAFLENHEKHISQTEYCMIRDYLFFIIHFGNGHRSGVSANVLMSEVEKYEVKDDGFYRIPVRNHKTFSSYGPANIVLSKQEFDWLLLFIKKARPFTQPKCNNVFLSWSGKQFTSGQVSDRLNNMWCRENIFQENPIKKLTCNHIRKSASTGIREKKIGGEQEAADLMAHSKKTADIIYDIRDKQKSAIEGSKMIRSVFGTENFTYKSPSRTPMRPTVEKTPPRLGSPNQKRIWTSNETEIIRKAYKSDIEQCSISLASVMEKFDSVQIDASPQQIYHKVRSLIRYSPARLNMVSRCLLKCSN